MGIIPAHRTRWDKRSRLNDESDLKFDAASVQGIEIDANAVLLRDGSNAFSHSFFIDKINAANFSVIYAERDSSPGKGIEIFYIYLGGVTLQLYVRYAGTSIVNHIFTLNKIDNSKTLITVVLKTDLETGGNCETSLYINGGHFQTINSGICGSILQNLPKFTIGFDTAQALPIDSSLCNYMIFNRELTPQEIRYLYVNGGLSDQSSHGACIAHYPLTQRQYLKASADFIVKHPQLSLNDLVALDVVDQYNYAKVTPIEANHGKLVNFTDAEAGADGLAPIGTSVKDFYLKTTLDVYDAPVQPLPIDNIEILSQFSPFVNSLKFDISSGQRRLNIATPLITNTDKEFTLQVAFVENSQPAGNRYLFTGTNAGISATDDYLTIIRQNGTTNWSFTARGQSKPVFSSHSIDLGTKYVGKILILTFTAKSNSHSKAYVNGVLISTQTNPALGVPDLSTFIQMRVNAFTGNGFESDATHINTMLFSKLLNDKEVLELVDNTILKQPVINNQSNLELNVDYNTVVDNGGVPELKDVSSKDHNIVVQNFVDVADVVSEQININELR